MNVDRAEHRFAGRSSPLESRRSYLVVSAREPLAAAVTLGSWSAGPPDLCVTSPSLEAQDTASFVTAGYSVPIFAEPLLARRGPAEGSDDFRARFAEGLRLVSALDARAALIVCDDFPERWTTPLVLDGEGILRQAALLDARKES